jgi:hypothetical protein
VALVLVAVVLALWARPASRSGGSSADASWADADWAILQEKVAWARHEGLDTVPLGEAMAAVGRSFVGTPYVPHTLEAEGPEALVINLRGLDCVTFVENVFALARFSREPDAAELMQDRARAEDRYEGLLAQHRYRDGSIDGYPSRLHYFTDWVKDNEARGLVSDLSEALGGVHDAEPIDFMSTHPDAYRQLGAAEHLAEVRRAEERLSRVGRFFVPEGRIEEAAAGIRNGDIIAATSTVEGLDVAHTGLALWVDGELRMLHAPLVGEEVTVSEVSLARRIGDIPGQDGIIVARPVER